MKYSNEVGILQRAATSTMASDHENRVTGVDDDDGNDKKTTFFPRHMKNENAENGPHKTRKMPYLLLLKVNDFYANELLM